MGLKLFPKIKIKLKSRRFENSRRIVGGNSNLHIGRLLENILTEKKTTKTGVFVLSETMLKMMAIISLKINFDANYYSEVRELLDNISTFLSCVYFGLMKKAKLFISEVFLVIYLKSTSYCFFLLYYIILHGDEIWNFSTYFLSL